jgi:crotonobetainyl-CoA:carnitine CoA-transferase CaiB-like acyl-CoA transferase
VLTDGFACYSIYACADGRQLTVGALEPKFFARLCELLGRRELAERQYEADQELLRTELAGVFAQKTRAEWLQLFEGEDVCVGPVATRDEAAEFAPAPHGPAPVLGADTERWRQEVTA